MDTAVKIKNVTVILGGKFTALNNLNLELRAGSIIGVIGPSGAGKTTLIRAIVGRQKITKGEIEVFGSHAGYSSLRSSISYMPQELSLYSDLTVNENLTYFAAMRAQGSAKGRISSLASEALELVSLTDKADSLVSKLSGGQKQRLSLAIALIGLPKLLVLDEPTVGLDPILRAELWKLFSKLSSQGITIIISSHSMDEASKCQDLILIRDGKVIDHSSPEVFLKKTNSQSVEEGFIKKVGIRT